MARRMREKERTVKKRDAFAGATGSDGRFLGRRPGGRPRSDIT
jgi:hypothetical protein